MDIGAVQGFFLALFLLFFSPSQAEDFEEKGLQLHNEYRKLHNSSMLRLNISLNQKAKECAEYYARGGRADDHSCPYKDGRMGENIYLSWRKPGPNDPMEVHVWLAIKFWYQEIKDYNFQDPRASKVGKKVGHFTQLVWAGSRQLGIGVCEYNLTTIVVALYTPPGNIFVTSSSDRYMLHKMNVLERVLPVEGAVGENSPGGPNWLPGEEVYQFPREPISPQEPLLPPEPVSPHVPTQPSSPSSGQDPCVILVVHVIPYCLPLFFLLTNN